MPVASPELPPDLNHFLALAGEHPSPCLVFRRPIIEANIGRALRIAGGSERFRPHVKTHKSPDMVRLQLARGVTKFKCATLAEAEMLAQAGASDVLVAYALFGPNPRRLKRLTEAFPHVRFGVLIDALEGLNALRTEGLTTNVWLDLDVGMGRTGLAPGPEALDLAAKVERVPGLRLAGFQVYDGHRHADSPIDRLAHVERELAPVLRLRNEMGVPTLPLVCGGTPSFLAFGRLEHPGIECSPGTVFLHDVRSEEDCPDLPMEAAAFVFTRVISRPGQGSVTLDLGSKAIASDSPSERRGRVVTLKGARPGPQSEEHWVVAVEDPKSVPLGSGHLVQPYHVCPTVALHEEALVLDEVGHVEARWPITARSRRLEC